MSVKRPDWTDEQVEQVIGNLLRIGVILSAAVVLIGGVMYLFQHGNAGADHRVFKGEPPDLCSPLEILRDALAFNSRGVIQFGLLLLVATPVARVAFTVWAFARERDYVYVGVTIIVLLILLYSLFGGARL